MSRTVLLFIVTLSAVSMQCADAFLSSFVSTELHERRPTSPETSVAMIYFGGLGGGSDSGNKGQTLPRDVKEAVSRCRQAVQEALQKKTSRMDVEFPVGTKFGVEKVPKKKQAKAETPTQGDLDRSDRELARLFVEMFQPLGSENICVVFKDDSLSDTAKQKWKGDSSAACRIMAMNRGANKKASKKRKKAAKPRGFAAKMAAEVGDDVSDAPSGPFQLPEKAELALFVAPGPKELVTIEKICNQVGMGTLVVLLNARLGKVDNFGTEAGKRLFQEEFDPVFCLTAAPQEVAPDCLMYRAFPGDWVLARKPKVGQPRPLLTQSTKPTMEDCEKAYASIDPSELDSVMDNALENVVGWFR